MVFANPNKGLVIIHPLTLSSGLSRSSLITTSPPKLCAYRNKGRSLRAVFKRAMTSFYNYLNSAHPRTPPEYPKPLRSTIIT